MSYKPASLLVLAASLTLFTACKDGEDGSNTDSDPATTDDSTATGTDADGDGVLAEDDCDDANPEVYPGRTEECNGVDDNCNELIDEGFGDSDSDDVADCMDTEECDGVDNNGDGVVDEGFADSDGDGVADCADGEECDGIDNNGDGNIDEGYDVDGDGVTQCQDDCDDNDASAYPGNTEVDGDGIDNDCDGMTDESGWQAGDLIIDEIMNNPSAVSDPNGEWFEILNASSVPLKVNGLDITGSDGDSHKITSDEELFIAPGEYMVLGRNDDTATNGGVDVDYVYTGVYLANESDDLSISADGTTLDTVTWDDGATMPDPNGASITLDALFLNDRTNADGWCAAFYSWEDRSDKGTPGEENEYCSTFDHDGDGFSGDDGDCDDGDTSVYPGAPEVTAGVDNDCDGEVEAMPTAVASYDSTSSSLDSCSYIYLDGTGSIDPDGSALTYSWELISAPGTSATTSSDITTTTSASPTFTPDVSGTYRFALTVNDGGTDSVPSVLSLTITTATSNTAPVAEAGDAQSYAESVTCQAVSYGASYSCDDCEDYEFTLDGTDSADAESPDHMTFSWSITAGSSYASIDDSTSGTPVVTVSGVEASYGSTNDQDVTLQLQVTDCYGGTDTDTVTVTYECTGA